MLTTILGLCLSLSPAHAGSLAGVTMSDTVQVGGEQLMLNGMGLREKYFIDIYVGGLYLKGKTTSDQQAITADEPKRIEMAFVYSEVTKEQLIASYDESLATQTVSADVRAKFAKLGEMMSNVHSGDRITFDYVPGTGTKVLVRGESKGTIEGTDFMRALWTVYLGASPPTAKLKRGMLGY